MKGPRVDIHRSRFEISAHAYRQAIAEGDQVRRRKIISAFRSTGRRPTDEELHADPALNACTQKIQKAFESLTRNY